MKAAGERENATPSAGGQVALVMLKVVSNRLRLYLLQQGKEHPESMAKLLTAQTEVLAAQAQVMTVQGFPQPPQFSGENLK